MTELLWVLVGSVAVWAVICAPAYLTYLFDARRDRRERAKDEPVEPVAPLIPPEHRRMMIEALLRQDTSNEARGVIADVLLRDGRRRP